MRTPQSKRPDRQKPLGSKGGFELRDLFCLHVGDQDESGCIPWTGRKDRYGYGCIWLNGRFNLAHRLAFDFYFNRSPVGMFVLHRCDNRICINPDHLFLGTNADNMADKTAKGRQVIGSQSCWAKLNEESVREIRERHLAGVSANALAKAYGVAGCTIHDVIKGRKWKHVPISANHTLHAEP